MKPPNILGKKCKKKVTYETCDGNKYGVFSVSCHSIEQIMRGDSYSRIEHYLSEISKIIWWFGFYFVPLQPRTKT